MLTQNEMDLAAESFAANSKTAEGGDLDIQAATLVRMCQAVGHTDAKCGRNFLKRLGPEAQGRHCLGHDVPRPRRHPGPA